MLKIRKAETGDAEALIELYMRHLTADPPAEKQDPEKWRAMIQKFRNNPFYHLLVGEANGTVVSSVTLVIVENLTHNNRLMPSLRMSSHMQSIGGSIMQPS